MPVFLKEITPRNILSFGPDTKPIELGPLNILIGPNGSGKTNLINSLRFISSVQSGDVHRILKPDMSEWLNKYSDGTIISVEVLFDSKICDLRHFFSYETDISDWGLSREVISMDNSQVIDEFGEKTNIIFNNKFNNMVPVIDYDEIVQYEPYKLIDSGLSILYKRRDLPLIGRLVEFYSSIRFHSKWNFGDNGFFRGYQELDIERQRLNDDYSNFVVVLNRILKHSGTKRKMISAIGHLMPGIIDLGFDIVGNKAQIFLVENDKSISSNRLSDGTLRFLLLLCILCDPNPPPVICIEEPELGMHPDSISIISDLLVEASERTQLIVTTHSVQLIDSFSDRPEVVMICEKAEKSTQVKRLDSDEMKVWLKDYSLGQLWTSGQIGGVR